ncbi:MAG TPA: hypothetical protein GX726_01070 [Clostridiales bacterium]|jgi:ech hydrogenase subunit B|nr:hypothetical protein [Clostridiales bacterium]
MSIKEYLPGIILFLILSPVVGSLLDRISHLVAVSFGAPLRSGRIDSLGGWLAQLSRRGVRGRGRPAGLFALLYLLAMAAAGVLFFAGLNLIWVIGLMGAANLCLIAGLCLRQPDSWRELIDNEFLRLFIFIVGFALLAFGLYLFTGYATGSASLRLRAIIAAAAPPIFELSGLLPMVVVFILIGSRAAFPKKGYPHYEEQPGYTGRELFLLQWGRWYEDILLFSFLFVLHFGQSLISGFVGVGVCLATQALKLSPIVQNRLRQGGSRLKYHVIALVCLALALANIYLLL